MLKGDFRGDSCPRLSDGYGQFSISDAFLESYNQRKLSVKSSLLPIYSIISSDWPVSALSIKFSKQAKAHFIRRNPNIIIAHETSLPAFMIDHFCMHRLENIKGTTDIVAYAYNSEHSLEHIGNT